MKDQRELHPSTALDRRLYPSTAQDESRPGSKALRRNMEDPRELHPSTALDHTRPLRRLMVQPVRLLLRRVVVKAVRLLLTLLRWNLAWVRSCAVRCHILELQKITRLPMKS